MKSKINPSVLLEVKQFSQMQDRLLASYDALADASGLDIREIERFEFDGNDEDDYLRCARSLLAGSRDQRRQACNSHGRKVAIYRRMLETYLRLPPEGLLSREQLQSVLEAALVDP